MREWILNHARATFWIWSGVGIVVVFTLAATGMADPLVAWMGFVVWTACGMIAINGGAVRGLRPAVRIMDEDCDPQPLLDACRNTLRQNPKALSFRVNEGLCLLLLGQEEAALDVLRQVEGDKRIWKTPGLTRTYCICRADLAKDLDEAAGWLDRLEQAAGKAPGTDRLLVEQRADLALRRGEAEGLEPVLLTALEEAQNTRGRVCWHWALARLYRLEGRADEAREHLTFTAEHANRLYIRAEAQALLDRG